MISLEASQKELQEADSTKPDRQVLLRTVIFVVTYTVRCGSRPLHLCRSRRTETTDHSYDSPVAFESLLHPTQILAGFPPERLARSRPNNSLTVFRPLVSIPRHVHTHKHKKLPQDDDVVPDIGRAHRP